DRLVPSVAIAEGVGNRADVFGRAGEAVDARGHRREGRLQPTEGICRVPGTFMRIDAESDGLEILAGNELLDPDGLGQTGECEPANVRAVVKYGRQKKRLAARRLSQCHRLAGFITKGQIEWNARPLLPID